MTEIEEILFRFKGTEKRVHLFQENFNGFEPKSEGLNCLDLTKYSVIYSWTGKKYRKEKMEELRGKFPNSVIVIDWSGSWSFGPYAFFPENFDSSKVKYCFSANQKKKNKEVEEKNKLESLVKELTQLNLKNCLGNSLEFLSKPFYGCVQVDFRLPIYLSDSALIDSIEEISKVLEKLTYEEEIYKKLKPHLSSDNPNSAKISFPILLKVKNTYRNCYEYLERSIFFKDAFQGISVKEWETGKTLYFTKDYEFLWDNSCMISIEEIHQN